MMAKRIGELEHILADLIQVNTNIEERLDKHGARLYTLEQLDIPQQVSIAVSEVVMDAVHSAMQVPLHNRFRDLPKADMKEILHQRMWESDSYNAQGLAEARKKNKKSRESPKTPPRSPSHQPPPLPLPAGSATPSPSKTAASTEYQAWTTTDIRLRPSISLTPADLEIDEDMAHDEQAQSSDDEDIGNWFCKRRGITELKPQDLEGPAYEIVKVFHPDVIHLQYQMKECHKLLTDSVDDPILRHNVSKPPPLGGLPGQVTIQSDFFFNKDLEYLRYGSNGPRPTLSISKMKAAYYPDAGLEQMVLDHFWIEEECKYDIAAMYGISHWWFQRQRFYIDRHTSECDRSVVRTHMRILSVVRIEVFSMYGYDYMKKIFLCHLNHLPPKDKTILTTAVNQWTRQLVIRQRVEDFQLGIESYQTQDQQVESRFKYEVLGQERRRSVQLVHVRDSEAFEDTEDLPQPRELCWRTLGFNSLVHSLRALSALRCSGLRTASRTAKPCQGDSSEFYLITESGVSGWVITHLRPSTGSYLKELHITRRSSILPSQRHTVVTYPKRTPYNNPQGIIYVDKFKRNRLMCSNELYKFNDGMLTSVRFVLHDIAYNLRIDYLPNKRWGNLDRQRSRIMTKAINKLMLERRLMRSLEMFVGGREYGEDFRLLERTI
nr:hypothetical protein [Tanacetum cinerariifolium]